MTRNAVVLVGVAFWMALTGPTTAAEMKTDRPQFSGIYPHLAALSGSYSECGIGAVVPWADRLWYVSYVAHKSGEGVGLFEITPGLEITRRPESIVGTHAGRMIHRESNQLIIGPYVIDKNRNVRVFKPLTSERVTAVMRHLTDPANKVYVQAMEGGFWEADVHTLEATRLFDAREELGIRGAAHFKGGYTAQGRVVVANNSYTAADVRAGTGEGRLAEWDGQKWRIIHRTAFCDVTTAGGIYGAPSDDAPLWSVGWDRRSILLAVLTGGEWTTYRLPKGSQCYDHAWCTEWPRIREMEPGQLVLDMHGLFYLMDRDFRAGSAGGLDPLAVHLRMTPDFCHWNGRSVLAGDQNSVLGHRDRFGGQPQSNILFTSIDGLRQWGRASGWGGPWYNDPVQAGVASEPFFIGGFRNRTLHVWLGATGPTGLTRCTDGFEIVRVPDDLAGLAHVTVDRGSMEEPGRAYSFTVNKPVTAYLAVHDRGTPKLPDGWENTGMKIEWTHGGPYSDTIYRRHFPAGKIEIPEHNGFDERKNYGVPHMAFLREEIEGGKALEITDLPADVNAKAGRNEVIRATGETTFTLEVDDGTGKWRKYGTITVPGDGAVSHVLPDGLTAKWMRITPDRDTVAGAQFVFGPHEASATKRTRAAIFDSFSSAAEDKARIHGAVLPFAGKLWFQSAPYSADGKPTEGGALFEVDENVHFTRRTESLPGAFTNRKMVADMLSVGPHLIRDDGQVRTIEGLRGEHVTASIRHPDKGKIYYLTADGRLLEADLETLEVRTAADIPKELDLADAGLTFKAGHLVGKSVIVAAVGPDGTSGLLADFNGQQWRILDRAAFSEVTNLGAMSPSVVAAGADRASALLKVIWQGENRWHTYRLPKGSSAFNRPTTMWARLREVQTERLLLQVQGMFYEVSGLPYAWSVRPVAAHDRVICDFGSWRGLTVMTGSDADAPPNSNFVRGDGTGLWLGKADDLWQLGKPAGRGGPWLETKVEAGQPSDPYLMAGFEHKRLDLSHDSAQPVAFTIEVNPTVYPDVWNRYRTITVPPGQTVTHNFPTGFGAHWLRLRADSPCKATAQLEYD